MTLNKKIDILWELDRSTGVKTLQTSWEILGIIHVGIITPSRTGSFTWSIRTPDEIRAFGSGIAVIDAMEEVEDLFQEYLSKYPTLGDGMLTPPVNTTHPSLDGVPAPKEIEPNIRPYLSTVPIKDQLVRTSNPNRFSLFNEKILCGEYLLSIQCNRHTYCSPREDIQDPSKYDSFEFAVMDKNYEFCGKRLFPSKFEYDDVLGYVDENTIQEMANIIKDLPEGYVHPNTKPVEEDEPENEPVEEEKPTGSTKFFFYRQNNSGGSFTSPAKFVIVEAKDADDANRRAEEKGLYFDGSMDCSCCGNRWSEAYGDEGTDMPEIYSTPAKEFTVDSDYFKDDAVIFYADGREEKWVIPVVKRNYE